MINRKVKSGYVGVSVNSHTGCLLLQTSSDNDQTQTRVSLTKEETQNLIELLKHNLNVLENN